jgi:predicted MPP superfamily phosphohydrolase
MSGLKHQSFFLVKFLEKLVGIIIRLAVIAALVWAVWAQNNYIVTRNYIYSSESLPKNFVGYKILHISDICNTTNKVVEAAEKAEPDIIVITGGYEDINGDYSNTVTAVNKLCDIAPVYYIYNTTDDKDTLSSTRAINLVNSSIDLTTSTTDATAFVEKVYGKSIIKKANKGNEEAIEYLQYISDELAECSGETIKLCGLSSLEGLTSDEMEEAVYNLTGKDRDDYVLVLNGNLANIDALVKYNVDVMFMGGTFGKESDLTVYKKGAYGLNGVQLFLSGGCGNYSEKRIFNLPEVQLITLSDGTITENNPLENFLDLFIDDVGTIYDNDGGFKEYTYTYVDGE